MKKIDAPIQQEIKIDEKTAEPTIGDATTKPKHIPNSTIPAIDPNKSIGKQLVINTLGLNEKVDFKNRQKVIKRIFSILFAVFVIGVLIFTAIDDFSSEDIVSWSDIREIFVSNWEFFIYLFLTLIVFFLVRGIQRSIFCKSITGRWKFFTCIQAGVVCQLYNHLTPFGAGGQPFEIHFVAQNGIHGGHASAVPLSSYVISMFSNVAISLTAIILFKHNTLEWETLTFIPETIYIMAIIGASLNLLMPLLVIMFSIFPRFCTGVISFILFLGSKLKIIKDLKKTKYNILHSLLTNSKCIKSIFRKPLLLISTFCLGLLEQLALASLAYFTLKFFGFDWPDKHIFEWIKVVLICIIINNAVSFIPTPGSSGAADLSFYAFFSTVLKGGFAFPAMITWRIFCFYLMILIGFIMLRIKAYSGKSKIKLDNLEK